LHSKNGINLSPILYYREEEKSSRRKGDLSKKTLFEKSLFFFEKGVDKREKIVYNTVVILRQQVPVKAKAFLPRCDKRNE